MTMLEKTNEGITEKEMKKMVELRKHMDKHLEDLTGVFELDAKLTGTEKIGLSFDSMNNIVLQYETNEVNHKVVTYSLEKNEGKKSDSLLETLFSKKYIARLDECLKDMSFKWKKSVKEIVE